MRRYQPIWEALKVHRHLQVECAKSNQRRLIKAVIKEKDMDKEYKIIAHCRLYSKKLDNKVEFWLGEIYQ